MKMELQYQVFTYYDRKNKYIPVCFGKWRISLFSKKSKAEKALKKCEKLHPTRKFLIHTAYWNGIVNE